MNKHSLDFSEFPSATKSDWHEKVLKELRGGDFEEMLVWQPFQGISLQPYYDKSDSEGKEPFAIPIENSSPADLPDPIVSEYVKVTGEKQGNSQALEALQNGATGVAFATGTSVAKASDLCRDILPQFASISFHSSAPDIADEFLGFLDEISAERSKVYGTFFQGEGSVLSWEKRLAVINKLQTLTSYFPFALGIGYSYSNPVENLGLVCSELVQLVTEAEQSAVDTSAVLSRIAIYTNPSADYFLEVAKLRALRYLVHKVVGAYQQNSVVHVSSFCSQWSAETLAPHEDLLFGTTTAMAAIMGGANEICLFDVNDQENQRLYRNIANVLLEETEIVDTPDPLQGSYYVEELTSRLISDSWQRFLDIEQSGGFEKYIETNNIISTASE